MIWLANHPIAFATLCFSTGAFGREILAIFFEILNGLFFSLAVFSEIMRGF
jgi:hypothetical protein